MTCGRQRSSPISRRPRRRLAVRGRPAVLRLGHVSARPPRRARAGRDRPRRHLAHRRRRRHRAARSRRATRSLKVLPAPLARRNRCAPNSPTAPAVAIIKIGRHFDRIRDLLVETGHADNAIVVEYATTAAPAHHPARTPSPHDERPYFSTILCYRGAEAWADEARHPHLRRQPAPISRRASPPRSVARCSTAASTATTARSCCRACSPTAGRSSASAPPASSSACSRRI